MYTQGKITPCLHNAITLIKCAVHLLCELDIYITANSIYAMEKLIMSPLSSRCCRDVPLYETCLYTLLYTLM